MDTFEKLLAGLSKRKVEFILVGGLAVDLCGFSRSTIDVDILVNATPENINRIIDCLSNFGDGSGRDLKVEDFAFEEGCIRIIEDFPLDIFTLIQGKRYGDLIDSTNTHTIEEGCEIRFLSAQALIDLKSKSLREKDQLDVQALQKIIIQDQS